MRLRWLCTWLTVVLVVSAFQSLPQRSARASIIETVSPNMDRGAASVLETTPPVTPSATPGPSVDTPLMLSVSSLADPVISASSDVPLARPGDSALFTFTVVNRGDVSASSAIISSPVVSALQIVATNATQGVFTINGQTAIFTVGSIAPGQTITLTVLTRVRANVTLPADLINVASLDYVEGSRRTASVRLHVMHGDLPATGEHPTAPFDILLELLICAALSGILIGAGLRHRAQNVL